MIQIVLVKRCFHAMSTQQKEKLRKYGQFVTGVRKLFQDSKYMLAL